MRQGHGTGGEELLNIRSHGSTQPGSRSSGRVQPSASCRQCQRGEFSGSRPAGPTRVLQFVLVIVSRQAKQTAGGGCVEGVAGGRAWAKSTVAGDMLIGLQVVCPMHPGVSLVVDLQCLCP